jgi:hypothetical protein
MCPEEEHLAHPSSSPYSLKNLTAADGGFPLVGVLQLFAKDVPELPFPASTDLLQVLWCPFEDPHFPVEPVLIWRDSTQITETIHVFPTPHPLADDVLLPRCCTLDPERIVEYPSSDIPGELESRIRAKADQIEADTGWSFRHHLSAAPGLKVGGHPAWAQEPSWPDCPECSRTMDHLLTIPSAECDGESWRRWVPLEDRAADAQAWTGTGRDTDSAIWTPTDMCFSDSGTILLFVCTGCPDRPYAHRFDGA